MKFPVATTHIRQGLRHSACNCPIALAAKDAGLDVIVGKRDMDVRVVGGKWIEVPLPPEGKDFVARFDAGETVEPFELELDLDASEVFL